MASNKTDLANYNSKDNDKASTSNNEHSGKGQGTKGSPTQVSAKP